MASVRKPNYSFKPSPLRGLGMSPVARLAPASAAALAGLTQVLAALIKFIAILLLSLTSAGCATVRSVDVTAYSRHDAIDASVYELLASPERFDGRSVRVIGVVKFSFAFESQSGIYATPDDYLHNTQGLIEINSFDPAFPLNEQSLSDISGTYAIVEGVFHARPPIPEKSSDLSSSICIGKCWGGGFIESINRVSSWQY